MGIFAALYLTLYIAVLACCIFLARKTAKPSKAIGIVTAVVFTALWALPVFRAVSGHRVSHMAHSSSEDGSADGAGDVALSEGIIINYALCR